MANNIEDFFATIFRQVQYVLFERRVHESFLEGKILTYEDFKQIYSNIIGCNSMYTKTKHLK